MVEEFDMATGAQQREQFQLLRADLFFGDPRVPKQARSLEIGQCHCHARWFSHGYRHCFIRNDRRHDDLHPFACRKDGRDDGVFAGNVLARERGGGSSQRHQILEIERWFVFPSPAAVPFDANFLR